MYMWSLLVFNIDVLHKCNEFFNKILSYFDKSNNNNNNSNTTYAII